ncbi:MAG: hypothetical protein O3C23_00340 [bacterium]|nr:hypothetical protein [bacterium]
MIDYLALLTGAYEKGKLSHAYLLSGNDNAGKEKLVQNFTTFLLGEDPSKTLANTVRIRPEKDEITIGQIRALKKQLSLSAWGTLYKIGIIELADTMNQEAQSAFLKLLEEPRGNVLLLLQVSHPALLLDTICSRAQELKMYTFGEPKRSDASLLAKLTASSIAERFAFAERVSQDQKILQKTLLNLQRELRLQFLKELGQGVTSTLRILYIFQEVLIALRQTTINGRFAMERILIEL